MSRNHILGVTLVVILFGAVVLTLPPAQAPPTVDALVEPDRQPSEPTTTQPAEVLNESATSIAPDTDLNGDPVEDHYDSTTTTLAESNANDDSTSQSKNPKGTTTTTTPPASTTTTEPPPAGGYDSGAESAFASKINGLRSANGLGSLARSGSLDAEARSWAKYMAGQGSLSHSNIGRLIPPWEAAAENVGSGGSVDSIFGALAGSGGHKSNMLGDYTHFGIGVWVDSSGKLWTVHVFAR